MDRSRRTSVEQPEKGRAAAFLRAIRTLSEGASGDGEGRKVWRRRKRCLDEVAVKEGSGGGARSQSRVSLLAGASRVASYP